jgi:hypothetical protein
MIHSSHQIITFFSLRKNLQKNKNGDINFGRKLWLYLLEIEVVVCSCNHPTTFTFLKYNPSPSLHQSSLFSTAFNPADIAPIFCFLSDDLPSLLMSPAAWPHQAFAPNSCSPITPPTNAQRSSSFRKSELVG